jgi:hypothetical protein
VTKQKPSLLAPDKNSPLSLPLRVLADATVPLSPSVKNLGVILDSTLSMQPYITFLNKTCFFHLRRIASIRRYLTQDACVKLIVSLIFSRLDYCNSLLSGLPTSTLLSLQRIQNASARLVLKKKKSDHITPLLRTLHWLPVKNHILYKLCCLCYKTLNNCAPDYLASFISLHTPSHTLRSAADPLLLRIPRTKLSTAGQRAFTYTRPSTWDSPTTSTGGCLV